MTEGVAEFFDFLKKAEIFTVTPEMTLSDRVGPIVPPERRDFWSQVEYRDVLPLRAHSVHWLEKERERHNTHPIRGTPLLYNIWDSRAEGFATAFEEMMMGAGLMDKHPRAKELVYVLLAFRAVRAMTDLKLHSNEWTLEEAAAYASRTTPYGWIGPDSAAMATDLKIYLHQPGYGTTYVVGKVQVEKLMADYSLREEGAVRAEGLSRGDVLQGHHPPVPHPLGDDRARRRDENALEVRSAMRNRPGMLLGPIGFALALGRRLLAAALA